MLVWLRSSWHTAWRAPVQERVYVAAVALTLLLGVFLRLNGYLLHEISFWFDEALWANRLLKQPLLSLGIRPVGFMWLTKVLVTTFGATEVWFRLLPNLGALGSLLLMPYVASRLLEAKWQRVLLLLLFAIHPALVDFANEFKPYSLEVLIHLVPIALYLRLQQTHRLGYFYALLAFLPVSFLFAYNMAFAFPGLLLLCAWHAFHSTERRKLLAATVICGALSASAAGTIYKLALSNVTSEDRTESYWGRKYDVFYTNKQQLSRVDWTLSKYNELAALIGQRRDLWSDPGKLPKRVAAELASLDRLFWISLNVAGLWFMWRRRRDHLLLFALPVLGVVAANLLGKWPLGAFRTNVFLSVYVFPVPLIGMQLFSAMNRVSARALAALVLALTLVPGFAFGFDLHGHKRTFTRDHYQREVVAKLYEYRKRQLAEDPSLGPVRLVMDAHTYHSHEYYLNNHPEFRAKYQAFFKRNFLNDNVSGLLVGKVQQRLRDKQGVWVVASKDKAVNSVESFADKSTQVVLKEEVGGEHLIMLLRKK